jgi:uncharacterized low-complexity protein
MEFMMNNKISSMSALIGAAFVASAALAPMASAEEATFAATSLNAGYTLADNTDKSEAEHKCGADKKADGEAKCGADKKAAGEGKCGEGKCGADKKAAGEGKCGEGKCGADKKDASKEEKKAE